MLLASELARLKAELGINILTLGAEPYIGVTQIFEQVIQPHTTAGSVTSSSTPVTATGGGVALVTLTIADPTGISAGDSIIVDVDDLQEQATCRNLSGSTIDLLLKLGHAGTYPVVVEGGESLIREKLRFIRALTAKIQKAASAAGLKSTDDVEFFSARDMNQILGVSGALWEQRERERRELAAVIGMDYPRDMITGGGGEMTPY